MMLGTSSVASSFFNDEEAGEEDGGATTAASTSSRSNKRQKSGNGRSATTGGRRGEDDNAVAGGGDNDDDDPAASLLHQYSVHCFLNVTPMMYARDGYVCVAVQSMMRAKNANTEIKNLYVYPQDLKVPKDLQEWERATSMIVV